MVNFFINIIAAIITYAIVKSYLRWCDKCDQNDEYLEKICSEYDDYWSLFM